MSFPEPEVQMGFGDAPTPKYIFVGDAGDQDKSDWYFFDFDKGSKIPIPQKSLRCRIKGLKMVKKEFRGNPSIKLDISVHADQSYVIRSGAETYFTRGLLLAMQTMDDLDEPVCIVVNRGSEENGTVMFGRLYYSTNNELIRVPWDKETDIYDIIARLQERFGGKIQDHNNLEIERDATDNAPDGSFSGGAPSPASAPRDKSVDVQFDATKNHPRDFYASDEDDLVTVKQLQMIRATSALIQKDPEDFCKLVMGCGTTDLSKRGADHLINYIKAIQVNPENENSATRINTAQ